MWSFIMREDLSLIATTDLVICQAYDMVFYCTCYRSKYFNFDVLLPDRILANGFIICGDNTCCWMVWLNAWIIHL